jgi:Uma2 family endonuclease
MDAHEVMNRMPIPKQLIYEELNGQILYRKGYQDVLNKTKTIEEIMGCSSLQSIIIGVLVSYLCRNIEDEGYTIAINEAGLHLSHGNNLSADIAIYLTENAAAYQLDQYYFNIAPKIVMEVDVSIELENIADLGYVSRKTQALFDFGVEQVFWIFTHNKKILIAKPNEDWIFRDWTKDVLLIAGHTFNLMQLIEKKGYKI